MCRRRTRQDARMRAGRRNVRITHPDKSLFPDGTTKADLAAYYRDVAPAMMPHVRERPDRIVWDLDPSGDDFDLVRRTAIDLGAVLRAAGCEPFAMVTGSRGIHVVVAIRRRYAYGAVRDAALAVAQALVERNADDLTTEFYKEKREGRLFVDVNRNGRAQTAVPAYAVRPRPGAPVATPLRWGELEDG